jgi:hypothetical protein
LRHRFAFRFFSIPGARGRLLLGPLPVLIIGSVSTPPLRFFSRKLLRLSIRKEEIKGAIFGMEGAAVNADAG